MVEEVDILLYVALSEEFDTVTEVLGKGFAPRELDDVAITGYFGTIHSAILGKDIRLAAFPAGKMGNTRSASLASLLIEKFRPRDVVVLGIAGSLSNDMEPGDVFIPDSVNEYLANSATTGENETWTFSTSGNQFASSARLLNRFDQFHIAHKDSFNLWRTISEKRRSVTVSDTVLTQLADAGIELRAHCAVRSGDDRKLASGPAVGKGKAFVEWIKGEVDRKVAAIEMETAGVYDAGAVRIPPPRTIAIRGISDFADARKAKLEEIGKGVFRQLSMFNACSLFKAGVEAGLFKQDTVVSLAKGDESPAEIEESRVKSVLVLGGITSETDDVDAEGPRLFKAAMKLGSVIAGAGAQLIICSPFPDSADYFAAMGFASAKVDSLIQIHKPMHCKVDEKVDLFEKTHGHGKLTVQRWNYPGPDSDDEGSWTQAWLFAQLQALERADAVIALGGRVSNTAQTILHLAEAKGIPVVPYSFLGGAAQRAFMRRDWKVNHPEINRNCLNDDDGVAQAINIANQLVLDRARTLLDTCGKPKTAFVSFAHQDAPAAKLLVSALKSMKLEVMIGDDQVRPDQLITVSIEQAMLRSDVCAVLWSRNYAQSPWCYDELDLAITRQQNNQSGLWLFNLDDSAIVPARARKLPFLSVGNPRNIEHIVIEMMNSLDER